MKFSEKYSDVKDMEDCTDDGDDGDDVAYFKHHSGKCWICKEVTHFVDIHFEVNICSEECSKIAWKRYWDAERKVIKREEVGGDYDYRTQRYIPMQGGSKSRLLYELNEGWTYRGFYPDRVWKKRISSILHLYQEMQC